jgi:hypothetical protein
MAMATIFNNRRHGLSSKRFGLSFKPGKNENVDDEQYKKMLDPTTGDEQAQVWVRRGWLGKQKLVTVEDGGEPQAPKRPRRKPTEEQVEAARTGKAAPEKPALVKKDAGKSEPPVGKPETDPSAK